MNEWQRIGFWLGVVFCLSGCRSPEPPRITLDRDTVLPPRCAMVFFVDGMDRVRLSQMLSEGRLTNIQRYFVTTGVTVERAVASLPPTTYPQSVSLLTGCFPGHHGVVGNEWLNRQTCEVQDYIRVDTYRTVDCDYSRKTIYELLNDQPTFNIQFHTRRSVTGTMDNENSMAVNWFLQYFSDVDRNVGYCIEDVAAWANREHHWPVVLTFYFPGVDEVGHRFGSDSVEYGDALEAVDWAIGRICGAIESHSELASRMYRVLLTDHNHVLIPMTHRFDLRGWLEHRKNLRVHQGFLKGGSRESRAEKLDRADVVLVTESSRRAMLYVKGRSGWSDPPDVAVLDDLLADLIPLPAVGVGLRRDGPNRIRVVSHDGFAVVERDDSMKPARYRLLNLKGDPLGFAADAELSRFAGEGWHDSQSWLAATIESRYPDFVPQVVEMFDASHLGDLVLFADSDYSFDTLWAGSHGSCLAADMLTRMYWSGSDLPAGGHVGMMRWVDVMPTIVDLLGFGDRLEAIEPIDGISAADRLRHASP